MSDQPETPAPAQPPHESLGHRLGDLFHRAEPFAKEAAAAVAPEVRDVIRAHASQVLALAAKLLLDSAAVPYAGDILAVAEESARIARALHRT